jgi:hypothetical protein
MINEAALKPPYEILKEKSEIITPPISDFKSAYQSLIDK